ncbi:MAG: hypothetical protein DRI92_05580 [Aquificota bacterium]|nr:MAG: hypothetical protein DRI92_05580 [Aquificota bacterium]
MARKVTITIPNDLHERMQRYRERFSISSICAEAIRKSIDSISEAVLKAKKRFELLSLEEASDLAFKEGIRWAGCKASLEQLAFVCEFYDWDNPDTEALLLNEGVEELYNSHSGSVYDFVVAEGIIADLMSRFLTEKNEDIEVIDSFIRGARSVWVDIRREAVQKLTNECSE